jgi:hypothetical protein
MSDSETEKLNEDPLGDTSQVISQDVPEGVDRRTFMMRAAVVSATAVITGRNIPRRRKLPARQPQLRRCRHWTRAWTSSKRVKARC